MPVVSVVIPLYNKEPYIARAITSVLNQSCSDFELIVIDDGSTDNGAEIVRSFSDPRIRLITQENQGVSAARNRGIDEAISDLIAFLDADDEWAPTFLETIIHLRDEYPHSGAYVASYTTILPKRRTVRPRYHGIPSSTLTCVIPDYFMSVALGDPPVCSSVVAIPTRIFSEVGGFPVKQKWGEDDDLWGRIALKYPIAFSWKTEAVIHKDVPTSACRSFREPIVHPFIKTASDFLVATRPDEPRKASIIECIARYTISSASNNVAHGHSRCARSQLLNCETTLLQREKARWVLISYLPQSFIILVRAIRDF